MLGRERAEEGTQADRLCQQTLIIPIGVIILVYILSVNIFVEALDGGMGISARIFSSKIANTYENTFLTWEEPTFDWFGVEDASYLVYDMGKEEVIAQRNTEGTVAPASLTKLMTATVALNAFEKDDFIDVRASDLAFVKKGASVGGITPGAYTVSELIEAMLIASGNDAAYALATGVGRDLGTSDDASDVAMATYMNHFQEWQQENGLEEMVITDPSGHAEGDRISFDDAVKFTKLALEHPLIDSVVQQAQGTIRTNEGKKSFFTTNEFVNIERGNYERRVSGVKTGSLDNLYNVILRYNAGDTDYLIIILGEPSEQERKMTAMSIMDAIDSAREKNIFEKIENALHMDSK